MTVPTQASFVSPRPAGNGVTTVFNFGFKIFDATDLVVGLVDADGNYFEQTNDANFTVSGVGVNTGGQVTFTVAPAAGVAVDIRSQTAAQGEPQPTAFSNQGKFLAESHEDAFDRITRIVQDVVRQVYTFGIHGPDTELAAWPALPGPAARANGGLIFDVNGLPAIGLISASILAKANVLGLLVDQGYRYQMHPKEFAHGLSESQMTYGFDPGDFRRYGGKADAAIDGTSGTDSTAAINIAFAISQLAAIHPGGNFLFTNVIHPGNQALICLSEKHQCNFVAKTGSTGLAYTDNGVSAAKIDIIGSFSLYGNNCNYTGGVQLGYNGGGNGVYGTEGLISMLVRDLPAGVIGIDIKGNIGEYGFLIDQNTGGMRLIGSGGMMSKFESVGAKGFVNTAGRTVGLELGDFGISSGHIEAPASGIIPLYVSGQCKVGNQLSISPAAGATHPCLVEYDPSATNYKLPIQFYKHTGAIVTITNQNFLDYSGPGSGDAKAVYFGGKLADGTTYDFNGARAYQSNFYCTSEDFWINKAKRQSFTIRIATVSSVIKHQIGETGSVTTPTTLADMVNQSTATQHTTPTATDSSTAFAFGGKISSVSPSLFIFDVNDQLNASPAFFANIVNNTTGTVYNVAVVFLSQNVNGVTITRLCLALTDATAGSAVTWATALSTASSIDVNVFGFLR